MGGREAGAGGGEGGGNSCLKNCPEKLHSEDTDTRAVHLVGGDRGPVDTAVAEGTIPG